jgi:hypothetical protein
MTGTKSEENTSRERELLQKVMKEIAGTIPPQVSVALELIPSDKIPELMSCIKDITDRYYELLNNGEY